MRIEEKKGKEKWNGKEENRKEEAGRGANEESKENG